MNTITIVIGSRLVMWLASVVADAARTTYAVGQARLRRLQAERWTRRALAQFENFTHAGRTR